MTQPQRFWELIDHFLEVIHAETGFSILIYDTHGYIVRATDRSRIGDLHAGAAKIMRGEDTEYAVTPEEAASNNLVREGYSCPLFYGPDIVAGFGITGKLELAKPVAKIAARTIQAWLKELQIRERLAASEKKYREIFDGSMHGIFQSTLDGRFITANHALTSLLGYDSVSHMLSVINDLGSQVYCNKTDRENFLRMLRQQGKISNFHTRLRRMDGNDIDVRINARLINGEGEAQDCIEGQIEDITRQLQAERAIRISEEKYAKAFNNSPVWVVLSSLENGRYLEVNESFLSTMGCTRDEVLGKNSIDLETWVFPEQRKEIIKLLKKHGRVKNFEVNRRNRSGKILTMLFWGEVISIGDEECILSVSLDISERTKWESALTESEKRFRLLFDEAPVLYVITKNQNGTAIIEDANNTFLDRLGYRIEEVLERPLADFCLDGDEFTLFNAHGYQRALNGNFVPTECRLQTKSGAKVHTLLHSLPEYNEKKVALGTRAMFLDISAIKEAEEEAERLECALRQAQKMEAIGTLAGGIAHDFNNILSAVIGYSQLSLANLRPEDKIYKNIKQIFQAGCRARDLISQILTYSRQQNLEYMPLQLGPLIKETTKLLRATIPATIEIKTDINEGLDNIMADPTQIQQILLNLCTNSAQAMEKSGGKLHISLSQISPDDLDMPTDIHPHDSYLKMVVSDTGCGITPENLNRIFDPYFTTKEPGKGTGLGLSVAQGIIRTYNGAIHAKSEIGQGTSFTIWLPAVKNDLLLTEKPAGDLPTGSERILLVDDSEEIVEILEQMLKMLGYSTIACTNGQDAMNMVKSDLAKIDLVISDVTMPRVTGLELVKNLQVTNPDLPLILCSGFSSDLSPEKIAQLGIAAFLTKPIIIEDLAAAIRKALDKRAIN